MQKYNLRQTDKTQADYKKQSADSYFLNIQNDIDIRNAKYELESEIAKISTVVLA